MALPRNPIYLETLNEIVENNFTILTRSSHLSLYSRWLTTTNYSNIQIVSKSPHIIADVSYKFVSVRSEVFDINIWNAGREGADAASVLLYEKSKLHPNLFQTIKDTVIQSIALNNLTWARENWNDFVDHIRHPFWKNEEDILVKELILCRNIAVVVPSQKRTDISKRIMFDNLSSRNTRVHLGKETFFKSYSVFSLSGWVPPFIISRVKQIGSSGILEWWTKLLSKENMVLNTGGLAGSKSEKPTMEGNIVTVFVILIAGFALAFLVFNIEILCISNALKRLRDLIKLRCFN